MPDIQLYKEILRRMLTVRYFEEAVSDQYEKGFVHGTLHLCVGEEAAAVGSTMPLSGDDYIFTTHRAHGHSIGKGADIKAMMAEILGKSTGTNLGRGGSMHICDREHGIIGSNGVVGADGPIACGAALTIKLKNIKDRVSVCFFGDGAANAGGIMEAMNLAGAWKLPVMFVLTDNRYAVSTKPENACGNADFISRAKPFGLKPYEVDGNDVMAVYDTVSEARRQVSETREPCLIVEHTYRISPHSRSDTNKYRTAEEIGWWTEHGPLTRFKSWLTSNGIMNDGDIAVLESEVRTCIDEAVCFAHAAVDARDTRQELEAAVYAG